MDGTALRQRLDYRISGKTERQGLDGIIYMGNQSLRILNAGMCSDRTVSQGLISSSSEGNIE